MTAAVLAPGFTSSDWFQLLYPWLFFVIGEELGRRHARQRLDTSEQTPARVSFVRIISSQITVRISQSGRRPTRSVRSSGDESIWLALIAATVAAFVLAWLYLNGREIALGLAATPVALTFGLLAGRIFGQIQVRMFAPDWWLGIAIWLLLWAGAVGCGFVLLHPPAAPDAYDVLFDAFRRDGISLLDVFNGTVMFMSYQAAAAGSLILGACALLYSVLSVITKEALLSGKRSTWWRRVFYRGARTPRSLASLLVMTLLLLSTSFVLGSGYAYSWVRGPDIGAARILAPSGSLTGRTLNVEFVVDRSADVRITVQRRKGKKPIRRWRMSVRPGRHRTVRRLARPVGARLLVTLTPFDARGTAGAQRRTSLPKS